VTESGQTAGLPSDRVDVGTKKRPSGQLSRFGPAAVMAVVALIGLVVWLVVESTGGGSSSSSSPKPESGRPVALSAAGLRTLSGTIQQPVYWIGPRPATMYEVTQATKRMYVRYLPKGVKAGDPRGFLTIGTYAVTDAYNVMRKNARATGSGVLRVPGGGIAVVSDTHPTSVYVAFPGSSYQIEVYHPQAAIARRTALSGQVKAVARAGGSQVGAPRAITRAGLAALAASLGHPVYWAGPRANVSYELTQTPDGRIYVRYLPRGTPVGASGGYLTIATYPMKNAFAVTRSTKNGPGSVTLQLPNGGIAVYSADQPTNIHLAYPGADVQVEVYDPSASVPRKLVASGLVAPVG
jgi:hypothetical protein